MSAPECIVVQIEVIRVPMKCNTLKLTLDQGFCVELVADKEIARAFACAPPQDHQGTDKKARFFRVQLREEALHFRFNGRNRDATVFCEGMHGAIVSGLHETVWGDLSRVNDIWPRWGSLHW